MPKPKQRRFTIGTVMDMLGGAIEDLTQSPEGMPGRIWAEISPWVSTFTRSAAAKFLPVLTEAKPCAIPSLDRGGPPLSCTNHAIGACVCGRSACIHHCMLDQHGSIICYLCVAEVMRAKRGAIPPPPGPEPSGDRRAHVPPDVQRERVKRAFATLGLGEGASWAEIRRQHRKLLAEHHPDKHRGEVAKAQHEARYKEVSAAFSDLERFHKKSEAA